MASVEPLLFGEGLTPLGIWPKLSSMARVEFPTTVACSLGHRRNPVGQIREGVFLLVRRHKTKHTQKARLGLGQGILSLASRSALRYLNLGQGAGVGLSLSWVYG